MRKYVPLKSITLYFFYLLFLFLSSQAMAASTSWIGGTSTSWGTASNWTNGVPNSNLDVVIGDASFTGSNQPQLSTRSNYCKSLTIGNGTKVSQLSIVSTNYRLVVSGNILIGTNGKLIQSKKSTVSLTGNWTNNGIVSHTHSGANITFAGNGQSINGSNNAFSNITILNSPNLVTLNSNISVSNTLSVSGILNPGLFLVTVASSFKVNSTGRIVVNTALYSGNYSKNPTTLNTSGVVEYAGSMNQTIAAFTYGKLYMTSNSVKTLTSSISVTNAILVTAGTFDLGVYTANRASSGGNFTAYDGTFIKIGGTGSFPSNYTSVPLAPTATVEYYGTNQTVSAQTYGHLILSNATTGAVVKTMPATAFSVVGNFTSVNYSSGTISFTALNNISVKQTTTIGANTTFDGGALSRTHTFSGNWVNNGTFNGNTSTVVMNAPNTSISGTGVFNINNFTASQTGINAATGINLTFSGNLLTTGTGTFTHVCGGAGITTMSGTSKTISGAGITLNNLVIAGTITTSSIITLCGNLTVNSTKSLVCSSPSNIMMTGASKTISNAGTLTFYKLTIAGSATTASSFTMLSNLAVNGSLSASAGVVTFNGSACVLSGSPNLYDVTISTSQTLILSNFSVLGIKNVFTKSGTLNVTTSTPNTVDYNGSGNQTVVSGSYHTLKLSGGGTKTIAGAVTVNASLTIGTGVTCNAAGQGISIYGDWINNGTFTPAGNTVSFLGNTDSYLTGATTFNTLTINKSTAANILSLNPSSSIITSTVNMSNGEIQTNSSSITITNTRTGAGYIYGTITRTHSFTASTAYAFESLYNTITFSAVSGISSITVTALKGTISDFPTGASIDREYIVSVSGSSPSYTGAMALHYLDNDLNGNNEATMGLWRVIAGTWTFVNKTTNSSVNNWVNLTGLTDITGRWTIAETASIVQWTGAISSNWSTPGNWSVVSGTPSTPPSSIDVVQIGSFNYTNAPTISTAVSIRELNFYSTKASVLTFAPGGSLTVGANIKGFWTSNATHSILLNDQSISTGGSIILSDGVSGHTINLSINAGSVDVINGFVQSGNSNVTFTSNGELKIGGDYTKSGTGVFSPSTSTVTYQGSYSQDIANVPYYNLSVNKASGTTQFVNPITVQNDLSLTVAGQLDLLYNLTVGRDVNINSGSTINAKAALISIGRNWNNSGTFLQGSGKVLFNGSGNQTCSATPFNNFEINKTNGTVFLTGNCVVNDSLTIKNGTLDISTYTIERTAIGGVITLSNSSKMLVSGASNFPENYTVNNLAATSTVEYNGTINQDVKVLNYGNLVISNGSPAKKTLVSNITVNGDLTINSGSILDGSNTIIELYGNWIGNGTFVYANNALNCRGTGKTISGTNTFYNLTSFGSYSTLPGTTTSVYGALIINGTFTQASDNAYLYGDFFNNGTLTTTGITTFMGQAAQTIGNNGTLIAGATSVINYNGSVSPLIFSSVAPSYATVNVNNTAGIYPILPWTVFVSMTVGSGALFDGNGLTHTIYGNFTNNGTVTNSSSFVFSAASAPVTVNLGNYTCGTTTTFAGTFPITLTGSGSKSFNNVTISNSNAAGITPVSDWTLSGDLTIGNDAVLHSSSKTYSISGDIDVNGILDGGTSSFIVASDAAIGGLGSLTFNNITFKGLDSLIADIYVTGNFVNDGTFNSNGYTVEFTGPALSTISGTTTPVPFDDIVISKTASSTDLATNILVNGDVIINSNAVLKPSANTITLLGDWSNNGIFTDSIIPSSTVILGGTDIQNIGGSAITNFGHVTINNTSGVLVNSNQTVHGVLLLQAGDLASAGFVTVNLNKGCISGAGAGSISGNITTLKTVGSKGAHYVSSPLPGKIAADFGDDEAYTGLNYNYYDETVTTPVQGGWTRLPTIAAPFIEMKGYSIYFKSPKIVDLTGTYTHGSIPANSTLTLTRSGNLGIDGWNLVGNPFPSPIDWNAASGWTKTNVYNSIYFWDPANKRHSAYVSGVSINGATRYIPSMQAFWVRVDTSGTTNKTGTIGMTNAVRVTTSPGTTAFWRLGETESIIKLQMANANNFALSDETAIRISDAATDYFDGDLDAYKLANLSSIPNISSVYKGTEYAINSIPALTKNIVIPIKMYTNAYGNYVLTVTQFDNIDKNVSVILTDTLLHIKQDLKMNPTMAFTISAADTIIRFYLNLTEKQSLTTPVSSPAALSDIDVYANKHTVFVRTSKASGNASVSIINSAGQVVLTNENCIIENNGFSIETDLSLPTGIYMVQVKTGDLSYTEKVLLD